MFNIVVGGASQPAPQGPKEAAIFAYTDALYEGALSSGQAPLGATSVSQWFSLGTQWVTFEGDLIFRNSNVTSYSETMYPLNDYLAHINWCVSGVNPNQWPSAPGAFMSSPSCFLWYNLGFKPIDPMKFSAITGMLGFAAFLQIVIWLQLIAVQYELPKLSTWSFMRVNAIVFVRILSVLSLFFAGVGVLNLTSGNTVLNEFCQACVCGGGGGRQRQKANPRGLA